MEQNFFGGEVGSDESSGEDVLESLFPLKSRCNKRSGVSLELSPQLNSSSSTRGACRCNVAVKRFKKSTFSNKLPTEDTSNRTVNRMSNPMDYSAFDMSASSNLEISAIPTAANFAGVFHEDSRSAIRWDFSSNIVCPRLYADDIYVTMRELEKSIRLKKKFLTRQREIDEVGRSRVVNWMSHHHTCYRLKPETLHLAVSVLDRLLCIVKFPRSKAEPIAAVALMLASKAEDLVPLNIANLVHNIISYEVDKRDVMHIEQSALYHLNYRIQIPTAYSFANYFNMVVGSDAVQVELVNFLLELTLRIASFAENPPSEVALTALLVARAILHRDCSRRWLCSSIPHCGIRFEDVESNMSLLFSVFKQGSTLAPNVCKEYSKREHFDVAALRFAVVNF